MNRPLHLLGIARKAGCVEVGEEPVGAAARSRRARLVVLASDAAENTCRRALRFAEAGRARCLQSPFDKGELGRAVGRADCAMLSFTDVGLAASFARCLAASDPESYGEAAGTLTQEAGRALERKKERRRQEKKRERAKAKPWAAPARAGAARRAEEKGGRDGDSGREDRAPSHHSRHSGGPRSGTKRRGGRQVT